MRSTASKAPPPAPGQYAGSTGREPTDGRSGKCADPRDRGILLKVVDREQRTIPSKAKGKSKPQPKITEKDMEEFNEFQELRRLRADHLEIQGRTTEFRCH